MILVVNVLNNQPFKARAALLLSLFCLCLFIVACQSKEQFQTVAFSGATMGTTYNIKIVVDKNQEAPTIEVQARIDQLLEDFNQSLSTYISDSELMQFNAAPVGEWVTVSSRFMGVLTLSNRISQLSRGAFDPTVGPLVNLWGFGPDWHKDKKPSDTEIAALMDEVGYQSIDVDSEGSRVKKTKTIQLDFSAVAKGYGVDEVAELLWREGFHHFMVEIGGELRLHGHNAAGEAWRIGVEAATKGGKIKPIAVSEVGVATSGDYRNYFEEDGIRYSHTIDPTTGRPITHNLASVTVIAATSGEADALATAFTVLGGDQAMALAEQEGIPIYIIERKGEGFSVRHSTTFTPYLLP